MNRRIAFSLFLASMLLTVTPVAEAALRYVVVDGTNGTIVTTDLPPTQRPVVTRMGAGSYRLRFPFNVVVFAGHAQRAGVSGDATALVFTSVYDPAKPRELFVTTYGIASTQPVLPPQDGRMTIIVNR